VISVCIPTRTVGAPMRACLASLKAQDSPPAFEVLVCLTATDPDGTAEIRSSFPSARIGTLLRATPAQARNELVREATGDLLYFVDDDVALAPDALARLQTLADGHPEADVFGGPNLTPPNCTSFERTQGAVLSSFIGAGPVRRRYGRHPAGPADERWFILCNLAVRTAAMRAFDANLVCAEENALLSAMSADGVVMYYEPELLVYHERRPDLRTFAAQMRKYGRGRGQAIRRHPQNFRLPYAPPAVLLLYLVALAPAVAVGGVPAAAPLAAYGVALGTQGIKVGVTLRRARSGLLAAALIAVMHLNYGFGLLWGLLCRPRRPSDARWHPAPTPDEAVSTPATPAH
jgi:glycosyltransferase involved in cell wall biosynthesis